MHFDILWKALLVFEDQYEDWGMNCGGEKLFGGEAKVMVRGLRNVELEEVFLENRMDNKWECFVLERESVVSHIMWWVGNTYADVGLSVESHLFLFGDVFLILIRQERN